MYPGLLVVCGAGGFGPGGFVEGVALTLEATATDEAAEPGGGADALAADTGGAAVAAVGSADGRDVTTLTVGGGGSLVAGVFGPLSFITIAPRPAARPSTATTGNA